MRDLVCLNKEAFRWSVVLFRKKKKGAHNKKKRAVIVHVTGFVKRTYFEGEICGLIYNTAKLLLCYIRITGSLVIV